MARTRPLSGRAPSQRQLRVGEVIRRALSDILARGDLSDPELGAASITVSEVRAGPDLRHAIAYVMPLGGANADGVVRALNRNRAALRKLVTAQIDLRFSPELSFVVDASFDRMDRTRELMNAPQVRRDLGRD